MTDQKAVDSDKAVTALIDQKELVIGKAAVIKVDSPESHKVAQDLIESCYAGIKMAGALYDDEVAQANALHKSLCKKRKILLDGFEQAKQRLSDAVVAYEDKLEKEAADANQAAQAEAYRKEEEHLLDKAITHEEMGCPNIANEILDEPVVIPPPAPLVPLEKSEKLAKAIRWKAEVTDLAAFVKDLGSNRINDTEDLSHLLKPNQGALNKMAQALHGNLKIKGLRVFEDKKIQRAGVRPG